MKIILKSSLIFSSLVFFVPSLHGRHSLAPIQNTLAFPILEINSLTYDAGLVKPGDKVEGIFIVKNNGNADLEIKSVSPT